MSTRSVRPAASSCCASVCCSVDELVVLRLRQRRHVRHPPRTRKLADHARVVPVLRDVPDLADLRRRGGALASEVVAVLRIDAYWDAVTVERVDDALVEPADRGPQRAHQDRCPRKRMSVDLSHRGAGVALEAHHVLGVVQHVERTRHRS